MLDNTKQSTNNGKARVADVLKSSIERGLVDENDAVLIAGHGSHVVTDLRDPNLERDQMNVSWDDQRFQAFTERLIQLGKGARVN
jgi:hypothetical protein